MKYLLLAVALAAHLPAQGQRITLPDGEFMDTTLVRTAGCPRFLFVPYYAVGGKYPRSSETLRQGAQAFLQGRRQEFAGTGYVTFRFIIDCTGHRLGRVQVLETTARYQRAHFAESLVTALYGYLQTLTEWPAVKYPTGEPTNYFTYLTFKLQDGKVVAVAP